jgi:tRNA pseudouridine55 synthase
MPGISGILNINKPPGLTSHDVVARVRKLAQQRKVGHAGTLDPMATGVLLVCLGTATRLIEYMVPHRKQYRATIQFGTTTDTLDADGKIVEQRDASDLTVSRLQQILPAFLGDIQQHPPIYSAIKQNGQPLYKLARAGKPVETKLRPVTIYALDWVLWQPPNLTLNVSCSSGTYIRSLARDLGEAAQTGAHLIELSRTASGDWSLEQAVSLDTLSEAVAQNAAAAWKNHLYLPERAVTHLPTLHLTEAMAQQAIYGQQITVDADFSGHNILRAYDPAGNFLAILTRIQPDDKLWQPKKVFPADNS